MAISFTGGASGPITLGNDATTQTLFAVENGIASRVNVIIRDLHVSLDPLTALTAVMPLVKTSRGINISGGITLAKQTFDSTQTSDPAVVFRAAMGEGAPITATSAAIVYQEYASRMHTAVEQVVQYVAVEGLPSTGGMLPPVLSAKDFILRPGESLIVQVIAAATTSNAALCNNWDAHCVWEEDEIATFAISGTVTLSGSPVSGAIVTVVEADDTSMTNAFLRETIVTGAGGTWASDIRTGKVGMVAWQYENAGTLYTAPSAPYLEP
jgi:hypothetical protein